MIVFYFCVYFYLTIQVSCWNLCLLCIFIFSLHNSGHFLYAISIPFFGVCATRDYMRLTT